MEMGREGNYHILEELWVGTQALNYKVEQQLQLLNINDSLSKGLGW